MAKEHHYQWKWDLSSSPESLWPLVSDTNRFNRDTGLPPMQLLGINNKVKLVRFQIPFIDIEWEEEPYEWTYPYHFGILRRYRKGPLEEMRVECQLERLQPSGTRIHYQVWVNASNLLGEIAIPIIIGMLTGPRSEKAHRLYDSIAVESGTVLITTKGRNLSTGGQNKFQSLSSQLKQQGAEEIVLDRLHDFLDRADDFSIQRMRPFALADNWSTPRRAMLETFLRATRVGMMDMYWDLLCPECRGVAEDFVRLGDIRSKVHCNTCQIDFNANFDHNVEVIFRPNASVRAVDAQVEFCVGSPQRQPHIIFSMIVPPREELPFTTVLNEGRYGLRVSGSSGLQLLKAVKTGAEKIDFRADARDMPQGVTELGLTPYIRLINETDHVVTFELERTAWSDQAATAADVTTLQVFRDLFSSEVLRPGEEISVGSTTLMFTDLRKSTSLYRQIGDATAFGRVREHFDILEKAIAAEGGAVVKTMGDSIMATFRKPVSAVRAIWSIQKQLAQSNDLPLSIKAGIHQGPCIVVNLDDRLDYFGSTVNIAARLPHFSTGGEVIFSEPVRNDSEVVEFLEKNASANSMTRFQSEIRGYEQTMDLWRVKI